jgi:predicted helicase
MPRSRKPRNDAPVVEEYRQTEATSPSTQAQTHRQSTELIKPKQKPITRYYETLHAYAAKGARHEGAVETAFQQLLADTSRRVDWTLIPKRRVRLNGTSVYPDGTLLDAFNLPRGYWEAKDTDDDLAAEIRKKVDKGYPLSNTIFEDTRRAVLFQDKYETLQADITKPPELADLLNRFYAWTKPEYTKFNRAIEDFKDRVPELARELAAKIVAAHESNDKFRAAFSQFFGLCKATLNPNMRQEAVDEMLVQHLLTERIIRKALDAPDFIQRNVIAVEVENVITALVSKDFSRDHFQRSLDPFYSAIEGAASTIPEYGDKQHFLRTIYERFFQGYSVKTADTHGIVYTPEQIVEFMCASIEVVLKEDFGLALTSPEVTFLDPCTGTGNYVTNLIRRVPKRDLPRLYKERLFANEVMLLPYYVASLNIEHAFYERTGEYEPFEGLCFVDTLDLAEEKGLLDFMAVKNAERVERQKRTPITVVLGNPPYNAQQLDENDNNRNRKYKAVDDRVKRTYVKDSRATLRAQVYDPYVKFFRWASDRLGEGGVVCLITNNSFVDQLAFDGMRKHLMQDFTRIYHLHLEGNVRQNPALSGTQYNVFGIQVGVGITVAVRSSKHEDRRLYFHRIDKAMPRADKLQWLLERKSIASVQWDELTPNEESTWLPVAHAAEFGRLPTLGCKEAKAQPGQGATAIFQTYCSGMKTNADAYVYDHDRGRLRARAERMVEDFNSQLDRWLRVGTPPDVDAFLKVDETVHKWIRKTKRVLQRGKHLPFDSSALRKAQYRPFARLWHFFNRNFNEDLYALSSFFPDAAAEAENVVIAVTDGGSEKPFMVIAARTVCDLHVVAAGSSCQCFPFFVYAEDGPGRRENVTDQALNQFRARYADETISKWDIFDYVYGLLHHPTYRERFADNLKRELPRIPFAPDFRTFASAGRELAQLHLDYEALEPYPLDWRETPGLPLSYRVDDKMRLNKEKTELVVNSSLTLAGIPAETFSYRLGGRSALEWVIDQYQVCEDKRSGIRSDPNRAGDADHIVRLVGQVVQVSLKTQAIIEQLPEEFM